MSVATKPRAIRQRRWVPQPALPVAAPNPRRVNRWIAVAVAVLFFCVYLANGDLLPTTDAIGNMHFALSLLDEGNLSFTTLEKPFICRWMLKADGGDEPVVVKYWTDTIHGMPCKALYERGLLRAEGAQYYVVRSIRRDAKTGEPLYVNTSGPGPAIAGAPIFAASQLCNGKLAAAPATLWFTGKIAASLYVAISGGLLFLAGCEFLSRQRALLVAFGYALGTCVWSISSQAYWQHPSNELFLSLGILALLKTQAARRADELPPWLIPAGCGLALSCASCCRPTSGVLLASVGAFFLLSDRRALPWFVVGAIGPLLALAGYNAYYLGAPWNFGQTVAGYELARQKVGSPGAWQTPLWEGLSGNLFSASRGLFIFSPFLAFSLFGAWLAWRRADYRVLRPVVIGTSLMLIVESKHYDWWGGWTYGYRHIVDLSVPLSTLLIPVVATLASRRARIAYGAALVWSVAVQFVGAFAYDESWNAPPGGYELRMPSSGQKLLAATPQEARRLIAEGARPVKEVRFDIDDPRYRHRLWSWRDSEIWYYASRFSSCRRTRKAMTRLACQNPG